MSYLFNATTELLSGSTTAMPTTNGSFFFWFKSLWADSADVTDRYFFTANVVTNDMSFRKFTDKSLYMGWKIGAADHRVVVLEAAYVIAIGVWESLLCTWDDTANVTLVYLNGVLIGTQSATLTTAATTGVRTIGNVIGGGLHCNGYMAHVASYAKTLTAANATQLHAGLSPGILGPVNYWPLTSGGTTTPDIVGGDTMTVTGATLETDNPAVASGGSRGRGRSRSRAVRA